MDNNGYYDSKLGYTNNPNVYSNPVNPSQYYPNAPRPQQPNNGYVNNYSIPSDPANMQKKYKPEGSVRSRFPRWFQQDEQKREAKQQNNNIVIYSPQTFEDVQALIDHLKHGEQVIVDFSTINHTAVYRILDFMSGAIYALNGSIQQITRNIFLFAPAGVIISVPPIQTRKN